MSYPNLTKLLDERGIRKIAVAKKLKISERALKNKITGKTSFSWEQACEIQKSFFPDITKDELFCGEQEHGNMS